MWRASSEQRKLITFATSSGSAIRPSTALLRALSITSGGRRWSRSVRMKPGATAFTFTLLGPSSTATARVSPSSPALLAA